MAAVAYAAIRDAIESILNSKIEQGGVLEGARIYIEEEPQFGLMDQGVAIALFMDTRNAPDGEQSISKGTRTRMYLRVTFWIVAFSMDSFRKACDMRDAMMGALELVLMDNRTLNGTVSTSWLNGGELFSAKDPQNNTVFTALAEVVMTLDVSAINT